MAGASVLSLTAEASLACVAFDDAGEVLWANARFCALLGLGPKGAEGRSYWDLTAPGQRNRELNEITQGRHDFEKEFVGPGGVRISARVVGVARGREGGREVNVVWCSPSAGGAGSGGDDAVERQLRRQGAALLELARAEAIDAGRLDEAFARITEAASDGTGCERTSVWLFDESEGAIVCQDLFEHSKISHGGRGFELTARDYPGYFEALREDRTIVADDARRHPATREFREGYLEPLGITSMLEAPIRRGGRLIGVLCSEHVGPARSFSAQEAAFVASVADSVGRALEADARRRSDEALKVAHAALARHAAELEARVTERARSLRLLLDSTGEGFVAFDRAGLVVGEQSRAALAWFGHPGPAATVAGYVFAGDPKASLAFLLNLEQLAEGALPLPLLLDQMPRELARDGREFRLDYRPVDDGEASWLLVVHDATHEKAMERAELEARELQAAAGHVLRDRAGFLDFVRETERLVAALDPSVDEASFRRALHTLKGNAAAFGLGSIAEAAHVAEDALSASGGRRRVKIVAPVVELWRTRRARFDEAFGERAAGVELSDAEYRNFVRRLAEGAPHGELLRAAEGWASPPLGPLVARLGRQAEEIARRLGKQARVELEGEVGLRLPDARVEAFFGELGHLVRNAVDHGLETPDEREALGKPRAGCLRIGASLEAGGLHIWVEDDGRGIDFGAVAAKARSLGLPTDSHVALERALFVDGLSTREAATDLSGRGVGLAAVAAACARAGGRVFVASEPGRGTRFDFAFPAPAPAAASLPPSAPLRASVRPPDSVRA